MAGKIKGTLYQRGKVWWLKYWVNGQRVQKSLETGNLREAKAQRDVEIAPLQMAGESDKARALAVRAAGVEAELDAAIEAARPRLPVADAWRAFQADKTRPQSGPHTLADYARHWERFTEWLAAEHKTVAAVEQVTPEIAEAHMRHLEGLGLGPNRYNKARQALSLVLRVLSRRCGDMPDPFRDVKKRTLAPESHRALSVDELRRVCSTATGELRAALALGMFTGLRIADACQLQWRDIDLAAGRIVRVPSKMRGRNNKPVIIPLHPALRAILEETPKTHRRGPVNPELAELYAKDAGATVSKRIRDHFAVCGIDDVNTRKALADRKEAGVKLGRLRAAPVASFHSLRHSFVSLLANANVPLATVRELVGHHSESIQRVYLHADAEQTRLAVNALPALSDAPALPEPPEAIDALREEVVELAKTRDVTKLRAARAALT